MRSPRRSLRLSDAVRATGFRLVVCERPGSHPDRLGQQAARSKAAVLRGRRVAVVSDSWQWCYEVAHEIAELCHGFRHSDLMWMRQALILGAWHQLRSGAKDVLGLMVGPIDEDEAVASGRKHAERMRARRAAKLARAGLSA